MVPLIDVLSQNLALEDELRAAFDRVLRSGRYILGEEVGGVEHAAAALAGARHGIGVSSGTDGLLVALMALGIGPGDEVLCPSFTFFATAGCVARLGATPVFVDSCPACFNLIPDDLERKITSRSRAVIPVHLFGQAADMDAILRIARRHGLRVIEDAAQAIGATYRGRPVGGLGDFGVYSFFPTKNLGALGDAGMVITQDEELAERARVIRNHGMNPKYHHTLVGGNFRLDAIQAALLSVKLPNLADYARRRGENAERYHRSFSEQAGAVKPEGCCRSSDRAAEKERGARGSVFLQLPPTCEGNGHTWNQYTLRIRGGVGDGSARDKFRSFLSERGIGTEIYYPVPLHRQRCFARGLESESTAPTADVLAAECVSLPIYPEMTEAQQEEVIRAVVEFSAVNG